MDTPLTISLIVITENIPQPIVLPRPTACIDNRRVAIALSTCLERCLLIQHQVPSYPHTRQSRGPRERDIHHRLHLYQGVGLGGCVCMCVYNYMGKPCYNTIHVVVEYFLTDSFTAKKSSSCTDVMLRD